MGCLRVIRGMRDRTPLELLSTKRHPQGFSIYFSQHFRSSEPTTQHMPCTKKRRSHRKRNQIREERRSVDRYQCKFVAKLIRNLSFILQSS